MLNNEKLKDGLERALWTFLQAFLGVFLLGLPVIINHYHVEGINGSKAAVASLATASLAAGISAVKSWYKLSGKQLLG